MTDALGEGQPSQCWGIMCMRGQKWWWWLVLSRGIDASRACLGFDHVPVQSWTLIL